MKIPLWAKTGEGKWKVFPHEQLITFPDGKVGYNWFIVDEKEIKLLSQFRHLLVYSPGTDRMVLRDDIPSDSVIWL